MAKLKFILLASSLLFLVRPSVALGQALEPFEAFNRIIPGWTNYSTGFNATHDAGRLGDYASVAAFHVPSDNQTPERFDVIVIGGGTKPPDFGKFEYRVFIWSGLQAFISEPRAGDIATYSLAAPTGTNTTIPDAITRSNRGAYRLQFSLTNASIVLTGGTQYLIGFAARGDTQGAGELYVPTSSDPGISDVQAGDLIVGGWRYIVDAGGSTIYWGRLAFAFSVVPRIIPPTLQIRFSDRWVGLSWPTNAVEFVLESSFEPGPEALWVPVDVEPVQEDGFWKVTLSAAFDRQWFRLRH